MRRKHRGNIGERHGHAKLTEAQVLDIRDRYRHGESQSYLAREFHISQHAIRAIVTGKSWSYLDEVGRLFS